MTVPYQLHQKLRESIQKSQSSSNNSNLDILKDKPFWIWDREEHLQLAKETNQQCCFNHIVGNCTKGGREYPLFDYEKTIYDSLMIPEYNNPLNHNFKDKHLYVLKAVGLGLSTFMLRFMAWLALRNDDYKNSQMVIVTGPNSDLAVKLVRRMKAIFEPKLGITFEDKETVLNLNGCEISAYPANHISSFRSLENPKVIFLDESDFWHKSEQEEVRHVAERYQAKSNPFLIMVSTPNMPGSLMESIKKEPEETCIYKRLYLDYTYGLGRIYTREEVERARMSPSFEREMCLKFAGKIGNLLSTNVIDRSILLGEQLKHIEPNVHNIFSCGIDPAFGSSAFGIVLTEYVQEHDTIRVLYSEQFDNHPNIQDMIDRIFDIHKKYWNCWFFCDAANRGFLTSLKIAFNENIHYEKVEDVHPGNNKVIPVSFSTTHKQMISHLVTLFEDHKVAVPEQHDKLIIALKTAIVNEYSLDKELSAYNDLLDSLRLSLKCYKVN
jgi:hypothetical protein